MNSQDYLLTGLGILLITVMFEPKEWLTAELPEMVITVAICVFLWPLVMIYTVCNTIASVTIAVMPLVKQALTLTGTWFISLFNRSK